MPYGNGNDDHVRIFLIVSRCLSFVLFWNCCIFVLQCCALTKIYFVLIFSLAQCLWVRGRFGRHQAHPDRWSLCHRRTDAQEHQLDPGQRQPISAGISRQGTGHFPLGRCASLCRHGGRPRCPRSPEKRRNCRFLEGNVLCIILRSGSLFLFRSCSLMFFLYLSFLAI